MSLNHPRKPNREEPSLSPPPIPRRIRKPRRPPSRDALRDAILLLDRDDPIGTPYTPARRAQVYRVLTGFRLPRKRNHAHTLTNALIGALSYELNTPVSPSTFHLAAGELGPPPSSLDPIYIRFDPEERRSVPPLLEFAQRILEYRAHHPDTSTKNRAGLYFRLKEIAALRRKFL
jgi:hypothetical protein